MSDVVDLTAMTVEVTHRFGYGVDEVWALLSDVERMAGLGPEHVDAHWDGSDRGVGARFTGRNRIGDFEWTVPCWITVWEPPHRLAWTVLEPDWPSSTWSYRLESDEAGTAVTQRFQHGPGPSYIRRVVTDSPDRAADVVGGRCATLAANMAATLAAADRLLATGEAAGR